LAAALRAAWAFESLDDTDGGDGAGAAEGDVEKTALAAGDRGLTLHTLIGRGAGFVFVMVVIVGLFGREVFPIGQ